VIKDAKVFRDQQVLKAPRQVVPQVRKDQQDHLALQAQDQQQALQTSVLWALTLLHHQQVK
jgi:hypothetical protein